MASMTAFQADGTGSNPVRRFMLKIMNRIFRLLGFVLVVVRDSETKEF